MKIAYIRSTFPKNSETFILEELIWLKKAGHDIRIYSRGCELLQLNQKVLQYGLLNDVVYENPARLPLRLRLRQLAKFSLSLICSKKYRNDFFHDYFVASAKQGGAFSALAELIRYVSRGRHWFQILECLRNVLLLSIRLGNLSIARQQLRTKDVEFVPDHAHCPFLFSWDTYRLREIIISHKTYLPYTVTLRSRDVYANDNGAHVPLRNELIIKATRVFAISRYNAVNLPSALAINRPLHVVHSSIDTDYFQLIGEAKREPNHIVCVARLVPKKGLDILVQACILLRLAGIPFNLTIVGDGPLRNVLESQIVASGLTQQIHFTGVLNQARVKEILRGSQIFVLPCVIASDGDRDMLPNSLKEAMAMKLAVVTSNVSGIEELITDRLDGLLAAPSDEEDLAKKLAIVLGSNEYAKFLGENARAKVIGQFSIQSEGARFEAELRRIQVAFQHFRESVAVSAPIEMPTA